MSCKLKTILGQIFVGTILFVITSGLALTLVLGVYQGIRSDMLCYVASMEYKVIGNKQEQFVNVVMPDGEQQHLLNPLSLNLEPKKWYIVSYYHPIVYLYKYYAISDYDLVQDPEYNQRPEPEKSARIDITMKGDVSVKR